MARCDNDQLQQLLRLVRNRLYRYVYAFEGHRGEVEVAIRDHEEIARALEDQDMDRAVDQLREHWRASQRSIRKLMSDMA